jgi:hypothetical protein
MTAVRGRGSLRKRVRDTNLNCSYLDLATATQPATRCLMDGPPPATRPVRSRVSLDLTSRTPQELAANQLFEPSHLAVVRLWKEPHRCRDQAQ